MKVTQSEWDAVNSCIAVVQAEILVRHGSPYYRSGKWIAKVSDAQRVLSRLEIIPDAPQTSPAAPPRRPDDKEGTI